jgi:hypothetical protein
LLITDLSAAIAGTAGGCAFAGRGTRTLTFLASLVAADRDFLFDAEESFLKFESQVFAQIGATLNAAASASAAAERIAKPEEFAEDIAEILEHTGIESGALRGCAAESGVAIAVVNRSLFGVGQDRVSFADFFEPLLRIRIIRIAVGVVLQREFAVRALEFDLSDRAGNAQNLVVVSFCVCRQKRPFLLSNSPLWDEMNVYQFTPP